jgi:glutathione S-transferase
MADNPVLYGFDGSTFVRTLRMVLEDKDIAYDQVPVNVLAGEPRQPEHLARHPFGKVPVLDIDGMRIRETDAICRYLDDTAPEPALMPASARERATANEAISLINSYGYPALLAVAGYHLFPDFLGGKDDAVLEEGIANSRKMLKIIMENKGSDTWLAGDRATLADYFLAPILFYVSLTPDAERVMSVEGVQDWWAAMKDNKAFARTEPDLG